MASMKILIVHAHPEPQSFCAALCREAQLVLEAQGHEVQISDLYENGFQPVASAVDFSRRKNPHYLVYALEQRHAHETATIAPDIRRELDKLLWCDLLILNFPIFWCAPPAILKGWFDRVLLSGAVYGGMRFYDRGGLRGKRAMCAVTIGAQEHMFQRDGIHGDFLEMLKPVHQGTLAYTGMDVLPPFVGWHVPYVSNAERSVMLQQYRDRLADLQALEALTFPSLDDYDKLLRPLGREQAG
ncbi:NAD(P)H-dependent oxidoreductase [Herbaspirillum sp. NPDC087042]|uniref:NAD(P)H-dependent oxidoreductase n=1 Tax=Herbaspirillum sp. NPDC087042 TaxID=3364004 RepID=UPI0038292340